MSGIFGFINMDGRPASREHFRAMAEKMAPWGPDGVGSMITGNAAFVHALLMVTHESRFEKMPVYDQDEGIIFTAAARLDNRDELCDTFGIAHPGRPVTSDGQLVLRAYKKWGADSCKHIFGDWSFAAWHSREKRLFLARDHLGNTGLYYYFQPPLVVFASDSQAILVHPEVPRKLNELHLARRMVFDIAEDTWAETYWENVCFLPASHIATFTERNKNIARYWRLDEAPAIRFKSDDDCLEGFLEKFSQAVHVRLNSIRPIGTTLSAGLDSSAVTALAAKELRKANQPLVAYTSVPLYPAEQLFPDRITDEWPLAHQIADQYDNIEHIPIPADDMTPLGAIKRSLDITNIPQHAAVNMIWITSLFENAGRRDLGVMLTGQLGNGGVSWSGDSDYIYSLLARGEWRKGFRAMKAWKKRQGYSWYRTVKSHILRPVLLPLWSEVRRFLHPEKQINLIYAFPQKDFIKQLGFNNDYLEKTMVELRDPLRRRIRTTIYNGTVFCPFWHSYGAFYNMEVRDPTADVRLLEFCMGVPDEQNTFEGGQRMLIRRAMTDILPDAVCWNTKRGLQAADVTARMINQRKVMEMELSRLASATEIGQYLDIEAMKRAWDVLPASNSFQCYVTMSALLRSINTGFFLLSFAKRPAGFKF